MYRHSEYEDIPEVDATVLSHPFSQENLTEDQRAVLQNEIAGQLYAYRYSNSTVVLGTRNATILGANIGIGLIADGKYRCRAVNLHSMTERNLMINVSSK